MRLITQITLMSLMILLAVGCRHDAGNGPSEEIKVVLNDSTPPQPGCELLRVHMSYECRDGLWHMVSKAAFQCGQAQIIKDVHVMRTNQKCAANDKPSSLQKYIPIGTPDGCTGTVKIFTFYNLECPQNATWNWIAYDLMQCADGRFFILRVPSFDIVTSVLCDQPPPPRP